MGGRDYYEGIAPRKIGVDRRGEAWKISGDVRRVQARSRIRARNHPDGGGSICCLRRQRIGERRPWGSPPQTDPDDSQGSGLDQDDGRPGARAISPQLIHIRWQANTERDLAGYKVYRRDLGASALKSVSADTLTYADRSVLPATTYEYYLTAYDIAGNQSIASPVFRATTPPKNMPIQTFSGDVFPILESNCSNCHAAFASASTALTRLTSVGTGPCAGQRLVIPGNALRSLLFQIVTDSYECGELPLPGPLPWEQANVIGAWINQGGLNN